MDSGYLFHFFNHSREISGNPKPHALRNKIERVRDRDQLYKKKNEYYCRIPCIHQNLYISFQVCRYKLLVQILYNGNHIMILAMKIKYFQVDL